MRAQTGTTGVTEPPGTRDQLAARRPGAVIVDAPVSGTSPAERGQRLIPAFGPAAAAGTVGPVFDIIGRKTVWPGEAGRGSQVTVAVNAYIYVAPSIFAGWLACL